MTALSTLIPGLKRQVAIPGEFASSYPSTTDVDLLGCLDDAFALAQMDGLFGCQQHDLSRHSVTPDLSSGGQAIIVLYAAESILRSKFRGHASHTKYKAGPVEYEQDYAASVLVALIKDLHDRRVELYNHALRMSRACTPSIYMTDAYVTRQLGYLSCGLDATGLGFWAHELMGHW